MCHNKSNLLHGNTKGNKNKTTSLISLFLENIFTTRLKMSKSQEQTPHQR